MYKNFFGVNDKPFSLSPDTSYFFCHSGHQEALNVLLVALSSGEGFVKIVGEVGTGKTLLCRELLRRLDDQYHTIYIPNPYLSPVSLRMALAEELGINSDQLKSHDQLLNCIYERLIELNEQGKRVVVCLDEVQAMPDTSLEALRLLTNLETEKNKLMQIVLFGQPELNEKLALERNRQIRQRIVYSYELPALTRDKVAAYIDHRLRVAGYNGEPLFNSKAIDSLYKASGGIPRLVNILSNKALMVAFGKGDHCIEQVHVRAAVDDTEGLEPFMSTSSYISNIVTGFNVFMGLSGLMLLSGVCLAWMYAL